MLPAQQRVALVTGSTQGLGRTIARRLARDGLAVGVNGLHGDGQALEVVDAIHDEGGVAAPFVYDVTDERQVADRPPPGRSAYVTAKSAQIGLTRAWARELAHLGITVNTVAPGFIPVERHANVPNETLAAYLTTVPAGRMGIPEDIAHAVSFFASEAAGFITGQRLVVDGGRHLRD